MMIILFAEIPFNKVIGFGCNVFLLSFIPFKNSVLWSFDKGHYNVIQYYKSLNNSSQTFVRFLVLNMVKFFQKLTMDEASEMVGPMARLHKVFA